MFVGHSQEVRHQTEIKINHTYKLINVRNIINSHQWNKPIENWDRTKSCQINKRPKKGDITKSY